MAAAIDSEMRGFCLQNSLRLLRGYKLICLHQINGVVQLPLKKGATRLQTMQLELLRLAPLEANAQRFEGTKVYHSYNSTQQAKQRGRGQKIQPFLSDAGIEPAIS
jgi:hypothetical protein